MYVDIHTNYSTVQTAVFCCLFSSHEPKARLAYSVPLTPARDVSRPFVVRSSGNIFKYLLFVQSFQLDFFYIFMETSTCNSQIPILLIVLKESEEN